VKTGDETRDQFLLESIICAYADRNAADTAIFISLCLNAEGTVPANSPHLARHLAVARTESAALIFPCET
jgi:hypothetical protein